MLIPVLLLLMRKTLIRERISLKFVWKNWLTRKEFSWSIRQEFSAQMSCWLFIILTFYVDFMSWSRWLFIWQLNIIYKWKGFFYFCSTMVSCFPESNGTFLFNRSANEVKDKNEKPFALAFVNLIQPKGTTLANKDHELLVYKVRTRLKKTVL